VVFSGERLAGSRSRGSLCRQGLRNYEDFTTETRGHGELREGRLFLGGLGVLGGAGFSDVLRTTKRRELRKRRDTTGTRRTTKNCRSFQRRTAMDLN